MKHTKKDPVGTSWYNCTVTATVNQLKAILGTPVFSDNDGEDKINFEWNMETESGDIFTVYDWKEYRPISEDEKIIWHIGGKSYAATIQAQAEIVSALNTPETAPISREDEGLQYYFNVSNDNKTLYIREVGNSKVLVETINDNDGNRDCALIVSKLNEHPTLYRDNVRLLEENKKMREALEGLMDECKFIPKQVFTEKGLIEFQLSLTNANNLLNRLNK